MAWGGGLNRTPNLNDMIDREFPDPPEDYMVQLTRSDLNSMLRTAARRGGEIVAEHAGKYQIEVRGKELGCYRALVRFEAIKKFVGL